MKIIMKIIIQNKQNFSNFFSKRRFNININKKIYVSFIMSNPLPIDLNITKIKLICEFKSEKELLGDSEIEKTIDTIDKINLDEEKKKGIIYEEKELILGGYNSNLIQLYVQGNKIGRIIIKGVEIIIENCINVKHYFNKKKKLDLYQYKRKIKNRQERVQYQVNIVINQGIQIIVINLNINIKKL